MASFLVSMSDDGLNAKAKALWEREALGGLTEDNNRVPKPIVALVVLTVMTAFAITFPLWGQRPNAAIYAGYVAAMDTPQIQAMKDDKAAMAAIAQMTKSDDGGKWQALRDRHPLTMDDLRAIAPQIKALEAAGDNLQEYNIVGDHVTMANFEGNLITDNHGVTRHLHIQPWWDKGYFIDLFFIVFFFTGTTIAIKRLPPSSWQPRHLGH